MSEHVNSLLACCSDGIYMILEKCVTLELYDMNMKVIIYYSVLCIQRSLS